MSHNSHNLHIFRRFENYKKQNPFANYICWAEYKEELFINEYLLCIKAIFVRFSFEICKHLVARNLDIPIRPNQQQFILLDELFKFNF